MMELDNEQIESQLRLHVDRLAGLIGPRYLQKPKTITATIGYIEGQWAGMGYTSSRECYDALGDQATNIVVGKTAKIQVGAGARIVINGRVVENPQECATQ